MSNSARSIVAVVAGFISIVVLSIGTDQLMRVLRIFPKAGGEMSSSLYLLATVYRILISIFGCYLTARLAPASPMKHALWLGTIGVLFSSIGVAASAKHPELGPLWYPIGLLVVALPCAWIGGALGQKKIGTAD
jgi:hypothetical protein